MSFPIVIFGVDIQKWISPPLQVPFLVIGVLFSYSIFFLFQVCSFCFFFSFFVFSVNTISFFLSFFLSFFFSFFLSFFNQQFLLMKRSIEIACTNWILNSDCNRFFILFFAIP